MPASNVDFVKGLDFTALVSASAGNHNTLVDAATPYTDKGLVVVTTDTGSTPDVPDAATTTKWKRYLWVRKLSTSASAYLYIWNDNATSVATYLKWQRVEADFSAIQSQIDTLTADLIIVDTNVTNLQTDVSAANANAANALTSANTALTTANAANANATTALDAVNNPTTGAAVKASQALTLATTANTTATTAAADLATLQGVVNSINAAREIKVSAEYACGLNTSISFAHGFGGVIPRYVRWVMRCVTDDAAVLYVAGEEVEISAFTAPNGNNYPPFLASCDVTNIKLYHGIGNAFLGKRDGTSNSAAITPANWRLKCYYAKE